MKVLDLITWLLLIVGGLNWGFTVFDWNLVTFLFQNLINFPVLVQVVYLLIAASALYSFWRWRSCLTGGSCKS